MATVQFRMDSANLLGKELTLLDTELAVLIVDIFYLACIQEQDGKSKKYLYEYGASLIKVSFNSPLELIAYLKNVSLSTAKHLFERVTYYSQEKEKRELANAEKKLDLLEKARALRNRLIKDGFSPDEAAKFICQVLSTQNATIMISGPEKDR